MHSERPGIDLGLDYHAVDWCRVRSATFRIQQEFRYTYDGAIRDLRHRLVVVPRERHGGQRRLEHSLQTYPTLATNRSADEFGNEIVRVTAEYLDGELRFRHTALVEHVHRDEPDRVPGVELIDPNWHVPRRLTRPDTALCDAAAELRRANPSPVDLAFAVAAFVHETMTYTKDVTDIFTTAAVAFAMRRGVCQDYAHVMLALLRCCGLPGRYVSGHLLGEGATHSWVEVLVPAPGGEAYVLSLDPTHGCAVSVRYVVVAVGRDYDDIAPTSGTFSAPSAGMLYATHHVALTDLVSA